MLITLWKKELVSSHQGVHAPVYEPQNNSIYVTDGWGASCAALRLRRLSLVDGQETASVLIRDSAWCLYLSDEFNSIFVPMGRRIMEIDRKNLKVINQWKTNVPHYRSDINMVGRTLFLMSWFRPTLSLYNLDTTKCGKKKFGPCSGIFKINSKEVIICSGKEGCVWRYSITSGEKSCILSTPQFQRTRFNERQSTLTITLGCPYEIISDGGFFNTKDNPYFKKIRIYDLNNGSFQELLAPRWYSNLEINSEGDLYYLTNGNRVDICIPKNGKLKVVKSERIANGSEILTIIPECSIILTAFPRYSVSRSLISALKFEL